MLAAMPACNNGDGFDNGIPDARIAQDGTSQEQALTRIDPEPDGVNCPAGGYAVYTGLDANGDGVLQDSEIASTSYICNAPNPTTIEGSVVINNSVDAAKLVGVTMITGSLTIDATGLHSIDLSSLTFVGGDVQLTNFSGTVISAPALTMIGGTLAIDDVGSGPALHARARPGNRGDNRSATELAPNAPQPTGTTNTVVGVAFPALTSVGGAITIGGGGGTGNLAKLATLDLSALTTVTGNVNFSGSALAAISLPNVVSIGGNFATGGGPFALSLAGMEPGTQLSSIAAPKLTTVGGGIAFQIFVSANSTLTLPALTSVTGDVTLAVSSFDLTHLATVGGGINISAPATPSSFTALTSVANSITVDGPVAFPVLTSAASDVVLGTTSPPTFASLQSIGGQLTILQVSFTDLTDSTFPQLSSVQGNVIVSANNALLTVSLDSLTTIGGNFYFGTEGSSDTVLNTVSATSLTTVTGQIFFGKEPELATVDFPSLTSVGSLSFGGTIVDICQQQALQEQCGIVVSNPASCP